MEGGWSLSHHGFIQERRMAGCYYIVELTQGRVGGRYHTMGSLSRGRRGVITLVSLLRGG